MRLTFLGTGTSQGVPIIGCRCDVCTSIDPRDTRTRPSLWLRMDDSEDDEQTRRHIVIDTPAEFRLQALTYGLPRLDALLYTHAHADHIFGIDDIRRFNQLQREIIPLYASPSTIDSLEQMTGYIFNHSNESWALPKADPKAITGPFDLFGTTIHPLPVWHGRMAVFGFRIGHMAYITDCSHIPEKTMARLKGLELLILGALRHRPHPTHFSISEALDVIDRIKPERALLTHISHEVHHAQTEKTLPSDVSLAYDGLTVSVSAP